MLSGESGMRMLMMHRQRVFAPKNYPGTRDSRPGTKSLPGQENPNRRRPRPAPVASRIRKAFWIPNQFIKVSNPNQGLVDSRASSGVRGSGVRPASSLRGRFPRSTVTWPCPRLSIPNRGSARGPIPRHPETRIFNPKIPPQNWKIFLLFS